MSLKIYSKDRAHDARIDSLPKGRIALRKELSKEYSDSFHLGRPLDVEKEIVVTAGGELLSLLLFFRPR